MTDIRTEVGELHMRDYSVKATGELFRAGTGSFVTLKATYPIGIKPLVRSPDAPDATEDTPTHSVFLMSGGVATARLGVAWERKIKRGDHEGKMMYSIALNHPELPDWAGNLAAFPRDEVGLYTIEHRRQRATVERREEEGERD